MFALVNSAKLSTWYSVKCHFQIIQHINLCHLIFTIFSPIAEPLSVTDISAAPKDGTKVRISYKV